MISVPEFLELFDLERGKIYEGYELTAISANRSRTEVFNEANYHISMIFEWISMNDPEPRDASRLRDAIANHLEGVRTLTTTHPYKCVAQWPLDSTPDIRVSPDNRQVAIMLNGKSRLISVREARNLSTGVQLGWVRV